MAKKNQLTAADIFTYVEYKNLVDRLHEDGEYRIELFARLQFCTACRAGDVLNFRWKDILHKDKLVVTEQKTGKTRAITFNTTVCKTFSDLYKLLGEPDKDQLIFKSPYGEDKPISIQFVNRELKRIKRKYRLKIGNFSTHTFRKTFGRYVYDKNNHSAESLILLNKIYKHSSLEITKTYIGITQDEIDGIFNSIQF